jgi:hypothetical protein
MDGTGTAEPSPRRSLVIEVERPSLIPPDRPRRRCLGSKAEGRLEQQLARGRLLSVGAHAIESKQSVFLGNLRMPRTQRLIGVGDDGELEAQPFGIVEA